MSLAVSESVYVPAAENVAAVSTRPALAKVTMTGPADLAHDVVTAAPAGSPSSLTVPSSDAASPRRTDRLGPASTTGAALVGWPSESRVACSACRSCGGGALASATRRRDV